MRALTFLLSLSVVGFALVSCSMSPATREGLAAGGSAFADAAGQAVTAAETGGWAAGLTTLALGVIAAVGKGFQVASRTAREKRLTEVAEGVKRAGP